MSEPAAPTPPSEPATQTTPAAPAAPPAAPTAPAEPAKPAEPGAAGEPVVAGPPEKYEFKLPDGLTMDVAGLAKYEDTFRELGLTNDQAQRLIGQYSEQVVEQNKQLEAELAKQTEAWTNEIKGDPEFGGAKFDATVATAQKAIGHFGSPELKQWLEVTGAMNHPGLVKAFARIGKAMSEDTFNRPNTNVPGTPKPIHERMYPNQSH